MKKYLFAFSIWTLAAPALCGQGLVLSVMAQKQTLTVTETGEGIYASRDSRDSLSTDAGLGLGIAFGTAEGDARVLLEFGGVTADDVFDLDMYTLGVEKFFPVGPGGAIRPFIGGSLGYSKLDVESGYAVGTRAGDDSNVAFGASGGVQFVISPQMALEARLRYLRTDLEAELDTSLPANSVTLGVEDTTAVSAGVSFSF